MNDHGHAQEADAGLLRLICGQVMVHASMSGLRLAVPLLALGQGMGKGVAGLTVALFAFGQVLTALPAGRLADRRGVRRPLALGIAGAFFGTAVAAAWPTYPVLYICAAMTGGSVCVVMVAVQRHAGRVAGSGESLRRVFSWISLATATANFLGPFAAGLLIDWLGFPRTFAVLAAAAGCAWLLVRPVQEAPRESVEPTRSTTAWALWREPGFRRAVLVNWVLAAYWDIHSFLVPVLGHDRGLAASSIGSILGSFSLAAAGIRAAMPFLAGRLREWKLLTAAIASTGILFLVYPWMPNAWTMGACSVLLGVALGGVQPMVMTLLHQVTHPSQRGQAAAMRLLLINASNVATPILMGGLGAALGIGTMFLVLGGIAVACTPLGLKFRDVAP